ncbi:hypothetical protein BKA93DRAFT_542925 [Sparassis latifolia]
MRLYGGFSGVLVTVERPPLLPRPEREALFTKCFSSVRDTDMATGWFYSVPISAIKRDNMIEWLCWALFGTRRDGLLKEWEEEIEGYLAKIENFQGHKYESGWNNAVQCMKVSLDPVVSLHRPLLWYLIVAVVDTYTGLLLTFAGFRHFGNTKSLCCFPPRLVALCSQRSPDPDIVYWYRPHRSKTKLPILFLHGIGIGLWPYCAFLNDIIAADPDVGIIAIENLCISMRIYEAPLTRDAMLAAITRILDFHNVTRVVVAAHSYGTIPAAHLLRDRVLSTRIAASLLVDPIPFLLHLPAVAYNFVYRKPRTANELQLWYFASRDPDISRTLARHFFWSQNLLWKEDLDGRRVGVVLSGRDQVVDTRKVRKYLTGQDDLQFRWRDHTLEVLYYPDIDHAQVFDTKERRKPMIDIISRFVKTNAHS